MFLIINSTSSNTILSSSYLFIVFLEKKLPLLPIAASPLTRSPRTRCTCPAPAECNMAPGTWTCRDTCLIHTFHSMWSWQGRAPQIISGILCFTFSTISTHYNRHYWWYMRIVYFYGQEFPVSPFPRFQYFLHSVHLDYRGRLKGLGQVVWMLQGSSGRSGKQQKKQFSPNLAEPCMGSAIPAFQSGKKIIVQVI